MKTSELKAIYERYPGAFDVEVSFNRGGWERLVDEKPNWNPLFNWRLIPRLPESLPKPSDEMMNRAVYLGKGPIRLPDGDLGFFGWRIEEGEEWVKANADGTCLDWHYCIDIENLNAAEIIALNREPVRVEVDNAVTDKLIDALRPALIRRGWREIGNVEAAQIEAAMELVRAVEKFGTSMANALATLRATMEMMKENDE